MNKKIPENQNFFSAFGDSHCKKERFQGVQEYLYDGIKSKQLPCFFFTSAIFSCCLLFLILELDYFLTVRPLVQHLFFSRQKSIKITSIFLTFCPSNFNEKLLDDVFFTSDPASNRILFITFISSCDNLAS